MHISVVSVPVADPDAAKRFYLEQVGFELVAEATFGDDLRWIQLRPTGAQTSITLVTWFDEMPPGSLRGLVIDVDDLDATCKQLLARGVRFSEPPAEQAGGRFATFADPDGNRLSLHQA